MVLRFRIFFFISVACAAALAAVGSFAPASASTLGAIRGTVYDSAGHPLQHAKVVIVAGVGTKDSTATDASGRYIFPRVEFDTYTVTVTAAGLPPNSQIVTVASGTVTVLDFHLSEKKLASVVTVAKAGHPVSVTVMTPQMIQTLPSNFKLASVTETVPGVVPFSYDEPVVRGFHGVAYYIDGIPIPQTSSSAFAEVLDPRDIGSVEVYTGSFPAEYGGSRQGGVVNIISKRPSGNGGDITLTGGNYATGATQLSESFGGPTLKAYVSLNFDRTDRGLDSPTAQPIHDAASQSNEFMRLTYVPDSRDSWALHFSNLFSTFQIPIDTNPTSVSFAPQGSDDLQYEYARYASIVYNRLSADGQGYLEISPWYNRSQVKFFPDPTNDLASAAMASTFQDRVGTYYGLTGAYFRSWTKDNLKIGFTGAVEDFTSAFNIQFIDPTTMMLQQFNDNAAQTGTNFGIYAEDKMILSPMFTTNIGLRYDRSTGFTDGNQVSPRFELDYLANPKETVHFYYGRLYAAPALEDTRRSAVVIGGGSGLPVYDLKPETDSIYEFGFSHQVTQTSRWYINYWARSVANVLDTTQIGSTPIFTIFNSTSGRAQGIEFSYSGQAQNLNSYFVSYGLSESLASGISGGTFLFSPDQLQGANGFAPEDHDQTNTLNTAYTWRLSKDRQTWTSLQAIYGSGYPVQFENGPGRLPAHWELNASYGRFATGGHLGYQLQATNLTNNIYLIKLNNGFNTTQYARGFQLTAQITAPIH